MRKRRILIVEDEPDICYLVKEFLRNSGYKTIVASDGFEAIQKLRRITVDLVLLDIILPVMDGWSVVDTIKKNKKLRDIPIIIFTAKPEDDRDQTYIKNYRFTVIRKPFEWRQLIKKITMHLSRDGTAVIN